MAAAAAASTLLPLITVVSLFLVEVDRHPWLSRALVMSERPTLETMKGVSAASCRDQP